MSFMSYRLSERALHHSPLVIERRLSQGRGICPSELDPAFESWPQPTQISLGQDFSFESANGCLADFLPAQGGDRARHFGLSESDRDSRFPNGVDQFVQIVVFRFFRWSSIHHRSKVGKLTGEDEIDLFRVQFRQKGNQVQLGDVQRVFKHCCEIHCMFCC